MAGQDLPEHALTFVARPGYRFERLPAGIVHDVERDVQHFGDPDGPVGRLALALRRTGQGMPRGSGYALVEQFLLQQEYEFAVSCMHRDDRTQLYGARKTVHEDLVVGHD